MCTKQAIAVTRKRVNKVNIVLEINDKIFISINVYVYINININFKIIF
jgi:hypothetical protein